MTVRINTSVSSDDLWDTFSLAKIFLTGFLFLFFCSVVMFGGQFRPAGIWISLSHKHRMWIVSNRRSIFGSKCSYIMRSGNDTDNRALILAAKFFFRSTTTTVKALSFLLQRETSGNTFSFSRHKFFRSSMMVFNESCVKRSSFSK